MDTKKENKMKCCTQCDHCFTSNSYYCKHPLIDKRNPVNGLPLILCKDARDMDLCGIEAKLWEPKKPDYFILVASLLIICPFLLFLLYCVIWATK